MNSFSLINDCEFDDILNEINELNDADDETSDDKYKICSDCNKQMSIGINNMYMCLDCGFIKNIITANDNAYQSSISNYNTNNSFYMPIKCVGPQSYSYQKCIRNNTSEYKKIQETNIKKKIYHFNYNHDKMNIPKNIISAAIDQYKKIRNSHKVYRGDILNGIICGLIYYECLKESIAVKPKDIATWANISESNMSKGDKIIKILQDDKILVLPFSEDIDRTFIRTYLIKLDIDKKYLEFLHEVLQYINMYKICNINSRMSTKTAGLIYLIVKCENIDITMENISEEFGICITTFKTYYNNIIKKIKLLTPLFEKYDITQLKSANRKSDKKTSKVCKKQAKIE
jgi:transcription initiation factor TFIIIB Brf1 subunit/transcription initiation factor TFIIB